MADFAHSELVKIFRSELLPWARHGDLNPIFGGLPVCGREGLDVKSWYAPILDEPDLHPFSINSERWPSLGMHASRYAFLGCIIEGQADLLVGESQIAARARTSTKNPSKVHVISLSQKDFFAVPPGVAYSDSSRIHWERKHIKPSDSRILWINVLPMGVKLQMCHTVDGHHADVPAVLIRGHQFFSQATFLVDSFHNLSENAEIVQASLLALLLAIDKRWRFGTPLDTHSIPSDIAAMRLPESREPPMIEGSSAALRLALDFIASNLTQSFTLTQLARHSFVSEAHLKRIFRAELNCSVMSYVTERRLEHAKSLLYETDIVVGEVGQICGYPHHSHFSRIFTRCVGVSPKEFRSKR